MRYENIDPWEKIKVKSLPPKQILVDKFNIENVREYQNL